MKSFIAMRFIVLFIVICLVFLIYKISVLRKENALVEGLQNFEGDPVYIDYNNFGNKIKSENDPDLSGILMDGYFNATNFSSDKSYYDNDEITADIKYFNNTSHILMGYFRKQLIPKFYTSDDD